MAMFEFNTRSVVKDETRYELEEDIKWDKVGLAETNDEDEEFYSQDILHKNQNEI